MRRVQGVHDGDFFLKLTTSTNHDVDDRRLDDSTINDVTRHPTNDDEQR